MGKRKKGVDEELLLSQGDNDDDVSVADGLHLNTSTRNDWMTPLMMAIQLNPPSKPQPKPKEKNEKTKKQQQIAEQRRKQKLCADSVPMSGDSQERDSIKIQDCKGFI